MKALKRFLIGLMAAMMCLLAPTSTCFAAKSLSEDDLFFYGMNGIYFYIPGAERSCYYGNLSGDTVMAKVVNYMSGNNPSGFSLSENAIAGILANFEGESGFNPFKFENNEFNEENGYGIAQFTPSSNITGPLKSDSRTAGFFNDYFDIKYTKADSSTGYPKESVPEDVLDAWLSVQLDFFFGASSEFENTRMSDFRHKGGEMGLDYIPDNATVHEAMDMAKTAEDAARVFVWIMERPGDKPGAASDRGKKASKWLSYVKSLGGSSASSTSATSNGSDVTVIGDSITVASESEIKKLMPNADIHAQVSKQFYNGTSENPGGMTILQSLVDDGSLKSTVVYALGTNSDVTAEQVKKVVETAGKDRKVVFVTNYSTSNDYIGNNNSFSKAKNDNKNVFIADWKTTVEQKPSEYLNEDGIHPNSKGQEVFASIISNAVNGAGNTRSTCSSAPVNGGLTEAQAQKLANYYNGPKVGSEYLSLGLKNNCVSFSKFFVMFFANLSWMLGDGKDVGYNLAAKHGLERGDAPRPFAMFSVTGSTYGHTGIVVAVNGDDVMTVEAAYNKHTGGHNARVVHRSLSSGYFQNKQYGAPFVYLDSLIDMGKLAEIVGD